MRKNDLKQDCKMTWDQINQKYPEDRSEMDEKRELEFVKDCFECYEQDGFAKKFWSPFGDHKEWFGESFEVIGRCSTKDSDLSSLPMWNIKFEDGTVFGAYPEEIIPSEMKANGYRDLDELADLIRDILEKNNFNLYGDIEEQNREFCLEFGQATPEGEDWNETIWFNGTLESFADSLEQRALNFNVDDEAEVYISCRGKYGCPSSISDLITDAEWKKDALLSLSTDFNDAAYGIDVTETKDIDNESNTISKELRLCDFQVGQNVKYVTNDSPVDPVKEHMGTVKVIYDDHMIVDVPDISDHCRFEPDFNLNQLIPIPLEESKSLAEKIWEQFYAPYEKYTAEDHDRITSQLYLELEDCGENAFMLRTVLEDIVSRPQPAKLNLYRGDMTSTAWEEIADAFYVRPDDLKDNIDVHAYLVDGFCK